MPPGAQQDMPITGNVHGTYGGPRGGGEMKKPTRGVQRLRQGPILGPRRAGLLRMRLLRGAVPGSEGCYAGRPFLAKDLQHYG